MARQTPHRPHHRTPQIQRLVANRTNSRRVIPSAVLWREESALRRILVRVALTFDFRLSTFDFRLSTFDFRLSTFDFRLSTFDFRLSTFDFQLSTLDLRLSIFDFRFFAPHPSAAYKYSTCENAAPSIPSTFGFDDSIT